MALKHDNYMKKHAQRIKQRTQEQKKPAETVNPFQDPNLEPIYKIEPPITPVKVGYGYQGVVIRRKDIDELQCHICGHWFKSLSVHVRRAHKTTARKYKLKYELPLGTPLVAKSTSKAQSELVSRMNTDRNLNGRLAGEKALKARREKPFYTHYFKNNASFHNKFGLCDKQIAERFLVVYYIIKETPKRKDIVRYDNPLLAAIERRHGSINKYIKVISEDILWDKKNHLRPKLIASIRSYYFKYNVIPDRKKFIKNSDKILELFGSWNQALQLAGFDQLK